MEMLGDKSFEFKRDKCLEFKSSVSIYRDIIYYVKVTMKIIIEF